MIINRDTYNQLPEHPKPPLQGYVHVYGYGNSLWLMRSDGSKYDLLSDQPGGGGGGSSPFWNDIISVIAYWTGSGLTFNSTPGIYYIGGNKYTILADTATLGAADETLDRIDVLALDINEDLVVIPGTADTNPQIPAVDPDTQIMLSWVLVPAGSSTPAITTIQVYDEHAVGEWTCTSIVTPSGTTINYDSTVSPSKGSKHIRISKYAGTSMSYSIQFAGSSPVDISNATLAFSLQNSQRWTYSGRLQILLLNGSTQVGSVNFYDGQWGYSRDLYAGYQRCAIPISAFNPSQHFIDRIRFTWTGSQPNGIYSQDFDNIEIQGGIMAQVSVSSHARLHNPLNPLDHGPVPTADFGKLFGFNLSTGLPEAVDKPTEGVTPTDGILDWDESTSKYKAYSTKLGSNPGYVYFHSDFLPAAEPSYSNGLVVDGTLRAKAFNVQRTIGIDKQTSQLTGATLVLSVYETGNYSNSFLIQINSNEVDLFTLNSQYLPIFIGDQNYSGFLKLDSINSVFEIHYTNIKLHNQTPQYADEAAAAAAGLASMTVYYTPTGELRIKL